MSRYQYDPLQYKSPQRMYDPLRGKFVDKWITIAEFELILPDGRVIHVPKDFVYDKASVPRFVWWYIPRDDQHVVIAALIHDYLYDKQVIEGEWIRRIEADRIFHGIILQSGMRPSKAQMAYLGVRAGGWRYFNKRAKRKGNVHYMDESWEI